MNDGIISRNKEIADFLVLCEGNIDNSNWTCYNMPIYWIVDRLKM